MAPAPVAEKEASAIPYPEGIAIVKKALGTVSPELSGFLDTMLENRWVDAKPSEKKIGGAFYSRFNEFRIPRVFASYTGTITTVLQQAHELGHAFHYWMMRDLPVVQTEFPMTLTETASTINGGDRLCRTSPFFLFWRDTFESVADSFSATTQWTNLSPEKTARLVSGPVTKGEECVYGKDSRPDGRGRTRDGSHRRAGCAHAKGARDRARSSRRSDGPAGAHFRNSRPHL